MTRAKPFRNLDLSGLPTSDPGSGKPWLNGGALWVGPAEAVSPPVITDQPDDTTVASGVTATFMLSATGATAYQWQVQQGGVGAWANISGATSSSYSKTNPTVASDNGDKYRCNVSNTGGTTVSNEVLLTVTAITPTITDQPDDVSVSEGSTATFSVTATSATAYQWQKQEGGAGAWSNISGATSASYTTGALLSSPDSGDKYRCVVTGTEVSVTSSEATLTVIGNTAPVFTLHPVDRIVNTGQSVTLTATVTGTPTPTHQWQELI